MVDTLCPKCKGTFQIKEENRSVHICYDCLRNGKMDQYEKIPNEAKNSSLRH